MKKQSLEFGDQNFLQRQATTDSVDRLAKKSEKKIRAFLVEGRKYHSQEDWPNALKYYNEAWKLRPDSLELLTLVAYVLTQLDAREQAMEVVDRALKIHGANVTLCQILGVLATKMHFHNIAEKLWIEAIKLNPKNAESHANLLGAYYEQEKFDEAVAYAQELIPHFPDDANLWTILATCIQYTDHKELAGQFFEEALRQAPNHFRALNNYSLWLGTTEKGFEITQRAVKLEPENPEINLGMAMRYLVIGNLKEAWPHYEYRLDPNRPEGQNVRYLVDAPRWDGKPDPDLNLLFMSEQGIGDEVFWLRIIPRLMKDVKKLYVGCDYRLSGLIERSFPGVTAVPHASAKKLGYLNRRYPTFDGIQRDNPDEKYAYIAGGSSWQYYINTPAEVPVTPYGYLRADPERVAEYADLFAGLKPAAVVGISWKSSRMTAQRKDTYTDLDYIIHILKPVKAYVVVLQYTYTDDELNLLRSELGDRVIVVEGLDLKMDIEGNFALMEHLDMTIGPGIATQMFAMASGLETWYMAPTGRPWWNFGEHRSRVVCRYSPNIRWVDYIPEYIWDSLEVPKPLQGRIMELWSQKSAREWSTQPPHRYNLGQYC